MTPGQYIRDCRERAGLSAEDLALRFDTVPHVSAGTRAALILAIEADYVPVGLTTARALTQIRELAIDGDELLAAAANVEHLPFRIIGAPELEPRA